jgi:hypothetical protein
MSVRWAPGAVHRSAQSGLSSFLASKRLQDGGQGFSSSLSVCYSACARGDRHHVPGESVWGAEAVLAFPLIHSRPPVECCLADKSSDECLEVMKIFLSAMMEIYSIDDCVTPNCISGS